MPYYGRFSSLRAFLDTFLRAILTIPVRGASLPSAGSRYTATSGYCASGLLLYRTATTATYSACLQMPTDLIAPEQIPIHTVLSSPPIGSLPYTLIPVAGPAAPACPAFTPPALPSTALPAFAGGSGAFLRCHTPTACRWIWVGLDWILDCRCLLHLGLHACIPGFSLCLPPACGYLFLPLLRILRHLPAVFRCVAAATRLRLPAPAAFGTSGFSRLLECSAWPTSANSDTKRRCLPAGIACLADTSAFACASYRLYHSGLPHARGHTATHAPGFITLFSPGYFSASLPPRHRTFCLLPPARAAPEPPVFGLPTCGFSTTHTRTPPHLPVWDLLLDPTTTTCVRVTTVLGVLRLPTYTLYCLSGFATSAVLPFGSLHACSRRHPRALAPAPPIQVTVALLRRL